MCLIEYIDIKKNWYIISLIFRNIVLYIYFIEVVIDKYENY